jgi:hypothetical protein
MLTVRLGFGLMLGVDSHRDIAIPGFPVDPDSTAWTELIHCRVEAIMAKLRQLLAVPWWQVATVREAADEPLNAVAHGAGARSPLRASSLSRLGSPLISHKISINHTAPRRGIPLRAPTPGGIVGRPPIGRVQTNAIRLLGAK